MRPMFTVTQELHFCYGHRLLGHPGKCGRLHGHNGVLRITLRAEALDRQGMVADFDQIASTMQDFLDSGFDHRLLLHKDDPAAAALRSAGEQFVALEVSPTAENLARLAFDHARLKGLPVAMVEIVEQPGSVARYGP
jgi:6-pyruvoyltetrahydropterin/6-carboxytetrahydropterin synthase